MIAPESKVLHLVVLEFMSGYLCSPFGSHSDLDRIRNDGVFVAR